MGRATAFPIAVDERPWQAVPCGGRWYLTLAAMRHEIGEIWFLIRADLVLVRPLSHFPNGFTLVRRSL